MIRSSVSTSPSQSIITRRPFAITISIRRQPGPAPFSGCSGTITAGTNPATSPSRPSRYALRHANSSWLEIRCRRAVADARRGPEKLSSTIRSFSASGQRRRRPVSTISSRLRGRLSVKSSIPTISYKPDNSARRPTPGGYAKSAYRPDVLLAYRNPGAPHDNMRGHPNWVAGVHSERWPELRKAGSGCSRPEGLIRILGFGALLFKRVFAD